ncbi:flagellar basal-body MS-ring/collar protein FliF [Ketogulonicigenium vulgare]|nr:flagellar basal-body MS-ring/collar protein FliF [Ketogulonicigenium vulgare]ADO43509.1 flagellar M-ring protein FliF, putative [Ketogulonicigenium vulgare Y25]ALJ81893.1 flagellar M-ring protein FliF [Ketogulonicigenium vulgare]AOZ55544.1 Flagellar M-ring protein FliF, putative [Ketogulonicigenium vulgare]
MQNLLALWSGFSLRRRIILVAATLGIFLAVIGLARGVGRPDMALLYAGLDPAASAEVVAAVEQQRLPFEVRGDAIYVPAASRDLLRMTLAGAGLPAPGAQGYELLDNLSGFGTTAQMFDAAYWRAKEGELARTILAVPGLQAARVHISPPAARVFQQGEPATAAVTVTMASGSASQQQAQAFRSLIAAAVPGLDPGNVAVIDAKAGLIAAPDNAQLADTRQDELRNRVRSLLEARVGAGNAVVELAVETVTDTESIFERRLDPEGRVVVSNDVSETARRSQGNADGSVTVASNLPDGAANQEAGSSSSEDRESRNVTNYELSETSREVLRAPGAVRRLTVAVLVNEPTGPEAAPRAPDELEALRELVASAVGFDAARGDVITLRAMPFVAPPVLGTEAVAAPARLFDPMQLVQFGALALVALILGLFVLRPLLRPKPQVDSLPPLLDDSFAMAMPMADGFAALDAPDPVARLTALIADRQEDSVRLLQSWVEDGRKPDHG